MPIRITGLNSGLDTEAIISALVSSYNYKTDKYKKAQTKLSWKQDAWKALNTKIYSLYNSVGNLRLSTAYNLKSTKVSDPTKATVTAGNNAPSGTQKLNIIKMAQAGYLTGGKLDDKTSTKTTLAELGYVGGDAQINITKGDGTTKAVTVTQGTTVEEFMGALKGAGLSANYDAVNKRIFVSSKETGKDNDFTLTGGNVDGAMALNKLGLNVKSAATTATYESYKAYYGADGTQIEQNVADAILAYQNAKGAYDTMAAQNSNMSAAYGYASAYSAMMDALKSSGLNDAEQKKLQTLLGMSATERVNSVMDADGKVYTAKDKDAFGNQIYEHTDGTIKSYIQRVDTYTDEATGNVYTLNEDKTLSYGGKTYTATSEKDDDGNTIYKDTDGNRVSIKVDSEYRSATAAEVGTGKFRYGDADGNTYTQNDAGNYTGSDGKIYRLDGTSFIEVDADGNDVTGGRTVTYTSSEEITKTEYTPGAVVSDAARSADMLADMREAHKDTLTDDVIKGLTANITKVKAYENAADKLNDAEDYSREKIAAAIKDAYENGYTAADGSVSANGAVGVNALTNTYAAAIQKNSVDMKAAQETIDKNAVLADLAAIDTSTQEGKDKYDTALAAFVEQVKAANDILGADYSSKGANKVDGCDSEIMLNGIKYESSQNTYSINDLSITLQGETGADEKDALTITTSTDTQGIYDKIKDFLTQYNALINEITSLYNAAPVKGYEPLTDEEKDALSDTEIEKWETKIKDSLLRRDDSLESVMGAMTASMSKGFMVNGKMMYLSSFGIRTQGYLDAPSNQNNAYHIDGDEDDPVGSGKADKLMAAIVADPDSVVSFMQQLTTGLYNAIGDKMKSTRLSSSYTVYNDKEMAAEYSDYTSIIKKWEEKLHAQEDYYYKKFAAMETALSKLNSQTSSLSNLFGGGM